MSKLEDNKLDYEGETHMDIKVQFPFDLNNLFNMTYSFDVLK